MADDGENSVSSKSGGAGWIPIIVAIIGLAGTLGVAYKDVLFSKSPKPVISTISDPKTPHQSADNTPPPPPPPPNIDGIWGVSQITQSGKDFSLLVPMPGPSGTTIAYTGNGMISGHKLTWHFQAPNGDSGVCTDMIIADDNQTIEGDCQHANGATTPFVLKR